jgi:polyferredoxin
MENRENQYSYRRKLYGRLAVIAIFLTIILFLISQFIKNGVFGVKDISATFGIFSYFCLAISAIFLGLEINFYDKENKENK